MELWQEIQLLKQAMQAGLVGDVDYPEYHFRLWLALGKPSAWPPSPLDCEAALFIDPPDPPPRVSSGVIRAWYACNRAKLAVVYYGHEDPQPSVHAPWAARYDDGQLYGEIVRMREAYADGVTGSRDRPFEAFRQWKEARGLD